MRVNCRTRVPPFVERRRLSGKFSVWDVRVRRLEAAGAGGGEAEQPDCHSGM